MSEINKNSVLITGAYGFLGRHTARHFKSNGYCVTAIGHGVWAEDEQEKWGIDNWMSADITLENLINIKTKFQVIVHCGGSGTVAYSIQEPMKDFQRSVQSTLAVLEYMRIYNFDAKFIYPSSPAVQGIHDNTPIMEDSPCLPVSPYGVHKKISEDLCFSYKNHFGLKVAIIRFFSIYGDGLRKQLLWDASNKLFENSKEAVFWGKGDETRDWIHVDDSVSLIEKISRLSSMPIVLNAGRSEKYTVAATLNLLRDALKLKTSIRFNSQTREGDPKYYWANIEKAKAIGWSPTVSFEDGVKRYASWFKGQL